MINFHYTNSALKSVWTEKLRSQKKQELFQNEENTTERRKKFCVHIHWNLWKFCSECQQIVSLWLKCSFYIGPSDSRTGSVTPHVDVTVLEWVPLASFSRLCLEGWHQRIVEPFRLIKGCKIVEFSCVMRTYWKPETSTRMFCKPTNFEAHRDVILGRELRDKGRNSKKQFKKKTQTIPNLQSATPESYYHPFELQRPLTNPTHKDFF